MIVYENNNIKIIKYDTIKDVPNTWDSIIGDNIYMSKKFISFSRF